MVSPGRGSLLPLSPPNKAVLSGSSENPGALPEAPLPPPAWSSERRLYLCPWPDCWQGGGQGWHTGPGTGAVLTPGTTERSQGQKAALGAADQTLPQRKTRGLLRHLPPPSPHEQPGHSTTVVSDMALRAAPALRESGCRYSPTTCNRISRAATRLLSLVLGTEPSRRADEKELPERSMP